METRIERIRNEKLTSTAKNEENEAILVFRQNNISNELLQGTKGEREDVAGQHERLSVVVARH